ncbi:MAG: hypothetical protein H6Q38_3278 [Chloroflexi bacterium]|nr:hypothetical protein [Chloroflexota bacterium]
MNKDLIRQIVNVLAVIVMITINVLANALPINGQNTGEISDLFQVFFVPAGYVFSIWGLIYIGLLAFAVYQALPAQRENPRLRKIGYWFALSCVANSVWIFMWHYNLFPLSLLVMLVLLASLLVIYLRLDIGRTQVSTVERWCVNIPFSIYLGWITVATVANVTDVLYDVGWTGFGIAPEIWAVIMLIIAAALGVAMAVTRRDVAYLLVLTWAFAGIGVKQAASPLVATTAWIVTVLMIGMIFYSFFTRKGQVSPAPA